MEGNMSFTQDMDDEYEKLIRRMNPPRVVIDNESCKNATVIQVDSANRHGILLEVVQILVDLNLVITKAYISSDGGWFMDVFNVIDQDGNKITDEEILDYIQKSLGPDSSCLGRSESGLPTTDYTSIELIGRDRPGLLSELTAVLTHLKCSVVDAEVWTHNRRAAAVMHITDQDTGCGITDPDKLAKVKELTCNVLVGGSRWSREAKTEVTQARTHVERRLHQMMFDDRDYERVCEDEDEDEERQRPNVSVVNWYDKEYSVVSVRCKDRAKLLFDTVCTLTDMQYVVFHASVDTEGSEAYQEYYIRHVDGSPVKSEAERQRIILCVEAAIKRRVSEGLKLELCTTDRAGLLSDVTRMFRENSLSVSQAHVSTRGGKAVNTFYVRDASGYPVDANTIDSIRQSIGETILKIKGRPKEWKQDESQSRFMFGGLFKSRSFCNFGFVRECV